MELLILVIAEKPDLGKAIAAATPGGGTYIGKEQIIKTSFHGEEMVICWCAGHFLTLKDPEDYDEKYKKWSLEQSSCCSNWRPYQKSACRCQRGRY